MRVQESKPYYAISKPFLCYSRKPLLLLKPGNISCLTVRENEAIIEKLLNHEAMSHYRLFKGRSMFIKKNKCMYILIVLKKRTKVRQ